MRTAAVRPLCAPAASGNCSVGTTARSAPGWAALKTVLPMPSTKATHGMTQKGTSPDHEADREAGHGGGPQCVGADHQTATIPAVRRQTGRNGEDGDGGGAGKGDETRLDGGVGQRKGQERVGDGRRLRARIRQELTRLEQDEVAVAPEGHGRHPATLSRAAAPPPRDRRQSSPTAQMRSARASSSTSVRRGPVALGRVRSPSRDRAGRSGCVPSAWPPAARRRPGAGRRPAPPPARSR